MQLINNVKLALDSGLPFDERYTSSCVKIYPILIIHDHQHNVIGFNKWIDYWFQAELEILIEEGYNVSNVKPLTIIDIDTLILHQDYLKSGRIHLNEILDRYIRYTDIDESLIFPNINLAMQYFHERVIPFSVFIDHYLKRRNLRNAPQAFLDIKNVLYPEAGSSSS